MLRNADGALDIGDRIDMFKGCSLAISCLAFRSKFAAMGPMFVPCKVASNKTNVTSSEGKGLCVGSLSWCWSFDMIKKLPKAFMCDFGEAKTKLRAPRTNMYGVRGSET